MTKLSRRPPGCRGVPSHRFVLGTGHIRIDRCGMPSDAGALKVVAMVIGNVAGPEAKISNATLQANKSTYSARKFQVWLCREG